MNRKDIRDKVYNYPTKHKEGFIPSEIDELLKDFPDIDMDKFNSAFMGNTCMTIDGDSINFHCDVEKALYCGIEKRELKQSEWD